MTVITKRKQDIGPDKISIGTKVCILIAVPTLVVSVLMLCCASKIARQTSAKNIIERETVTKKNEEDWGDDLERLEDEL